MIDSFKGLYGVFVSVACWLIEVEDDDEQEARVSFYAESFRIGDLCIMRVYESMQWYKVQVTIGMCIEV